MDAERGMDEELGDAVLTLAESSPPITLAEPCGVSDAVHHFGYAEPQCDSVFI